MPRLGFDAEGQFTILQLTDLHLDSLNAHDRRTLQLIPRLIERARPQLIVLTGDFLTGSQNLIHIEEALRPLSDSNVPFVYVYGNHDAEYGAPHADLTQALSHIAQCVNPVSAQGISGHSNFVLEVGEEGKEPEWLLFGLDSHMYEEDSQIGGYDHLKRDQIDWVIKRLQSRAQSPSPFGALHFLHIPLVEYETVWQQGACLGQRLEDPCSSKLNSGFFAALVSEGNSLGVFAGHDHLNDYAGTLYGLSLLYGRASGYNSYSRQGYCRGGRVISLKKGEPRHFHSYLLLSDGTERQAADFPLKQG